MPSSPAMRRSGRTRTRPRGSSGKSVDRIIGLACTPAAQTSVSASTSPAEVLSGRLMSLRLPSALSREVLSRTSMPRLRRCSTTHSACEAVTSGMMRPMASTRMKRTSSWRTRGLLRTAARARSSISVRHSMPAKPPPTTTKVNALARSAGSVMVEAASMRSRTLLRSATASSMVFRPMPLSARPLMGKVRVMAPAAITTSKYGISKGSPPSEGATTAVRLAWSMPVTRPWMSSVCFRC
ncbi:hypothetical protein PJL18_04194 [Paenarthrobacter nicotinovorans]|nr:hypothetical protein [Paenarthrobacter nicotinovorans]